MSISNAPFPIYARATHTIRPTDIVEVLCHRKVKGTEEYFVRWRTKHPFPCPPRAPCSWHPIYELYDALHHVQAYLERRETPINTVNSTISLITHSHRGHKRKASDQDHMISRDLFDNGLPTPTYTPQSQSSRSGSTLSEADADHDVTVVDDLIKDKDHDGPRSYGVTLGRKEGSITAKISKDAPLINPRNLPDMWLESAARTPVNLAELMIRYKFMEMLKAMRSTYLENNVDRTTPSLNFVFIKDYVFRDIQPAPPEAFEGCDKCKPNMGANCGCEYTQLCACLEYAAVDEERLQKKDPLVYARWKEAQANNELVDTTGLPKRFPYSRPNREHPEIPQKLVPHYLEQRHPIYECNQNCACGPVCKSRLVQKGRRVGLTIFKTKNRGWGVYCNEDLVRGEFIDTYLGEVITGDEADRRESSAGKEKNSYFYSLDKFAGDDDLINGGVLETQDCYVVDGQYMGGPTRFINHSCEPNCRQYTVSYNKNDIRVYSLAFFAYEDIPAGTELTFDYMDQDEEEEEEVLQKREAIARKLNDVDKINCNCGAKKCRGYLWVNTSEMQFN